MNEAPPAPDACRPAAGRFLWCWAGLVALLALGTLPALDWLLLPWPKAPDVAWVEGVWQRKAALAAAAAGPRVLLVGGSSGHFSLDAELLEARLHRPVFNLCTHAALGLHLLLAQAREAARPGDTVLLYLEDVHYRRDDLRELAQRDLWTARSARVWSLPPAVLFEQLYAVPLEQYRLGWLRRNEAMGPPAPPEQIDAGYPATELGPCGDQRGLVTPHPFPDADPWSTDKDIDPDCARVLHGFLVWAKGRGIRVVAALPASLRNPERAPALAGGVAKLSAFYAREGATFFAGTCLTLPRPLLLDTNYHANAAGRRIVTESFAAPLARCLGVTLAEPEAATLLVASPQPAQGRELVLAERGAARCRLLSATPVAEGGVAMTPAEVRAASDRGERFLFADPEVPALLESAGLSCRVRHRETIPLGRFLGQYPDHVFALAAAREFDTRPLAEGLLEPFHAFLAAAPLHKVALLGTGRFSLLHLQALEERKTAAFDATETVPWQRAWPWPIAFSLRSGVTVHELIIDHLSIEPEGGPGLRVAVYDPRTGLLVQRATFTGPEWSEWELQEVVPHALP